MPNDPVLTYASDTFFGSYSKSGKFFAAAVHRTQYIYGNVDGQLTQLQEIAGTDSNRHHAFTKNG